MRKAFDTGRAIAGVFGGGQGSQTAGGTAQGSTSSGSIASGSTAGGGPPAPTGSRSSSSEESRNNWRKSMIDRTTPEQRSRYVEYRRAMDERREQRGLPGGWGR